MFFFPRLLFMPSRVVLSTSHPDPLPSFDPSFAFDLHRGLLRANRFDSTRLDSAPQEKYTVWDTLTASLCAIVHDNLPLELLNQPFHIAPEVSPLADPSTAAAQGNNASSSPAWMDTARPSSDEVRVIFLLCCDGSMRAFPCSAVRGARHGWYWQWP